MTKLKDEIETGKQRGHSKKVVVDEVSLWCNSAIQKYEGNYKVHVSVIKEDNIISEEYDTYFTREFTNIDDAYKCIEKNGLIRLVEFSALKGQKIFNPKLTEEN